MIINRYIQRNIMMGTATALLLLLGLALFFEFVAELDDMKDGEYEILDVFQYVLLRAPAKIVEFLPLSALLGSMLSLGSLASNSELIAMQASGITLRRMLLSLVQAALTIAVIGFLMADWVVPDSDATARNIKNQNNQQSAALERKRGLWIKDAQRIVHVHDLLPNGYANGIEIYQLGENGRLSSMTRARSAEPLEGGWELHGVEQTTIGNGQSQARKYESLVYPGNLSHELLQVLQVNPWQMSSRDLWAYLQFLDENRLDAKAESLIFWQKVFSPLTTVIMCLLAFPFALGSQRQSNTGKRLLIGILLGLAFVAINRVVTQLGTQMGISPSLSALVPNLLFLGLAIFLIFHRQTSSPGSGFFSRLLKR